MYIPTQAELLYVRRITLNRLFLKTYGIPPQENNRKC